MAQLEFFFDCSSPWTYLAFTRIHDVIARTKAHIVWKPILVGGVFNEVNKDVYERRANPDPRKSNYYRKDLADWARFTKIKIGSPPVFPVNSVKALRGALVALEDGCIGPYSARVFHAYFGEDRDISDDDVLRAIVGAVGLDPTAYFAAIASPACKDRIRANTEECVRRGGFGSPTMFVGDDMYFGNDRLVLVEAALRRARD